MSKREQILEAARGELYVKEDAGRNRDTTGRIAQYIASVTDSRAMVDIGRPFRLGDEWCAAFVSWVHEQIGRPLEHRHGKGFYGCGRMIQWLDKEGHWHDTRYDPQPGDIIFIDWQKLDLKLGDDEPLEWRRAHDNVDHVGIIERIDGDEIHTIEGNWRRGVNRAVRSFASGRVLGFGSLFD